MSKFPDTIEPLPAERQLSRAISFAAERHINQMDKGGKPYILHCLAVMMGLNTDDPLHMAGAVLHDVVEDQGVTFERLRVLGFDEEVIAIIEGMTKRPGETVNEYIRRARTNPKVVQTKLSDLRHNMDPTRLKGMAEKDMVRMNKYAYMYHMLDKGYVEFSKEFDEVEA